MAKQRLKRRKRVGRIVNYIGRLAALTIFSLRLIAWVFVLCISGRSAYSKWSLLGIPETLIAFWLGYHYDKHRFNSQRDELTRLYNRRFIVNMFPKLAMRAYRKREKIGVFVVDVNNLKFINDSYGHQIGDLAIRHVAALLLSDTRKSDFVARWGGDEFLIITRALKAEPVAVSDRIRQNMIAIKVNDDAHLKPSVSIGAATFPDDGFTLERLIDVADGMMYKDKAHTRPDKVITSYDVHR